MADYVGAGSKAAFKKDRGLIAGGANTYPQAPGATDMGASHQFAFSSDSLQSKRERAPDDSLVGSGSPPVPDIFRKMGEGSVPCMFRWRGLERLFACAMGFENAAAANSSPFTIAAGAYEHLFEMDTSLVDRPWSSGDERAAGFSSNDRLIRRGQVGIYKGNEDWVFYSSFITKVTMTGSPQEGVRVVFDYIAYDRVKGSFNHGSWAVPSGPTSRILFHQALVRIGLRSGGDAGTVEPYIGKWELTIERPTIGDDQSSATGLNIEIPVPSDKARVTLKFERPRYTDRGLGDPTWIALFESDLEFCAKIVMTGPQIGVSGFSHRWGFFMTSMKRAGEGDEPNVQGPGPLRNSWTFEAYSREAGSTDVFAASNYSGITLLKESPLVVTCRNADNFNYMLET